MALHRTVNGQKIKISLEEEAKIRAEWAANTLRTAIRTKSRDIQRRKEEAVSKGFVLDLPGHPAHGARFQIDQAAMTNILVLMSVGIPNGVIHYWDMNNVPHAMDAKQFKQFAEKARDHVLAINKAARSLKDTIKVIQSNGTESPEGTAKEILDINSSVGWPD